MPKPQSPEEQPQSLEERLLFINLDRCRWRRFARRILRKAIADGLIDLDEGAELLTAWEHNRTERRHRRELARRLK